MNKHIRSALGLSFLSALIVFGVYVGGLFRGVENFLEDRLFSPKPLDSRIVIVAIDNESLTKIGQWPWPRKVFADAIRVLSKTPPAALAIDVVWSEASRYGKEDDRALADALGAVEYPVSLALEASPLLLSPAGFTAPAFIAPLPAFLGRNVSLGHVNLPLDQDNIARTLPTLVTSSASSTQKYPALAYEVTSRSGFSFPRRQETSKERIVYAAPPGSLRRIPFHRLSEVDIQKELAGKIVFLGATAPDLHDEQAIPFSRGVTMPGVEIQAQVANMLLAGLTLAALPDSYAASWIFLTVFLVLVFFLFLKGSLKPIAGAIFLGITNFISATVLFDRGTIVPIIVLQLAWFVPAVFLFIYRYFSVEREKRELRHVFSKYVSHDVLNDMLKDPSKVRLGGEEKEATIFFSDVRGFTTLSEKMTPTQLTHFLNKYLTVMTEIILEKRGVVDKYIGDAIMAFWGAPLTNTRHAMDGIETALLMASALEKFNTESVAAGDPPIDIGIGLNSGRVTAGNMGSENRFDYTVMGDTVNLASRLESLTKQYGVHILISNFTYAQLDQRELSEKGILLREIDCVKVKGKKLPVTLYEVVDPEKREKVARITTRFAEARAAYYAGEWPVASRILATIIEEESWDGPSKTLYERCAYFLEHPPEAWDGSYEMKNK